MKIMNTGSEAYRTFRAARNVLEMIGELHQMGYEGLIIHAGLSPSGLHWRVEISAAQSTEVALYSTADGTKYFGWSEVENNMPQELAHKFREHFRVLIDKAHLSASKYVVWYAEMLRQSAPLGLIEQYCDWEVDYSEGVPVRMFESAPIRVPQPPNV